MKLIKLYGESFYLYILCVTLIMLHIILCNFLFDLVSVHTLPSGHTIPQASITVSNLVYSPCPPTHSASTLHMHQDRH